MKKAAVIIVCYFISIFISNFVVARELNVRWFDGLIPGGNKAHGHFDLFIKPDLRQPLKKIELKTRLMLYGVMMV